MNIDTYNAIMTIKYSLQLNQVLKYIDVLIFYMIPLTKKCTTMSVLHIQDAKKGWIKTNWRKRKESSVVELRYELAFLNTN